MSQLKTRIRTLEKRHASLDKIPGVPVVLGLYGPRSVLIVPDGWSHAEVIAEAEKMRAKGCSFDGTPLPESSLEWCRAHLGELEC